MFHKIAARPGEIVAYIIVSFRPKLKEQRVQAVSVSDCTASFYFVEEIQPANHPMLINNFFRSGINLSWGY